jgi:phage head maturation protease
MASDDFLIFFGGAVKALGNGKIGGYVVRFGSPETADVQGDYFTPHTDYGLDCSTKARVVYHHGLTKKYGPKRFGTVDLSVKANGIEAAGELDLTDAACKAVYNDVEAGKLGWSSGSVDRLVERRAVKGKSEILAWPLIEVSLTPTPVDGRNRAIAIKALIAEDAIKGKHLGTYAGPAAAGAALDRLHEITSSKIRSHMYGESDEPGKPAKSRADRMAACKGCMEEHSAKSLAVVDALMDEGGDEAALKSLLDELGTVADLSMTERSQRLVADLREVVGLYARLAKTRQAEGRHLSAAKLGELKALRDGLDGMLRANQPKADPADVQRLRARLLRARIA